jgi:hypothetical protein
MVANPLIAEFAHKIGHVELTDAMVFRIGCSWLLSLLIGLAADPVFKLLVEHMTPARELARSELERMGPPKRERNG